MRFWPERTLNLMRLWWPIFKLMVVISIFGEKLKIFEDSSCKKTFMGSNFLKSGSIVSQGAPPSGFDLLTAWRMDGSSLGYLSPGDFSRVFNQIVSRRFCVNLSKSTAALTEIKVVWFSYEISATKKFL